jgi:hypothetical protein
MLQDDSLLGERGQVAATAVEQYDCIVVGGGAAG